MEQLTTQQMIVMALLLDVDEAHTSDSNSSTDNDSDSESYSDVLEEIEEVTALFEAGIKHKSFIRSDIVRKKKRIWVNESEETRETAFACLYGELMDDDAKCYEYFKMSKAAFLALYSLVENDLKLQDTNCRKAISPLIRLSACLSYLTSGLTARSIAGSYHIGISTTFRVIEQTCKVLVRKLIPVTMPNPTAESWERISTDFYKKYKFPNCLGVLVAKLIPIVGANSESKSVKMSYVLMALIDSDYNFIRVDAGNYTTMDGDIYTNTKLGKEIETDGLSVPEDAFLPGTMKPAPHVFVAKDYFTLTTKVMRPYAGKKPAGDFKTFNDRIGPINSMSESVFEVLTDTFGIYKKRLHYNVKIVDKLIMSTCALYNHIKKYDNFKIPLDAQKKKGPVWQPVVLGGGRPGKQATEQRDLFKQYFCSEFGAFKEEIG